MRGRYLQDLLQQPLKEHPVDPTTKANFAIDFHHGDTVVIQFNQAPIHVDIHSIRAKAILSQQVDRIVAKVAPLPGVDDDIGICVVHARWS